MMGISVYMCSMYRVEWAASWRMQNTLCRMHFLFLNTIGTETQLFPTETNYFYHCLQMNTGKRKNVDESKIRCSTNVPTQTFSSLLEREGVSSFG